MNEVSTQNEVSAQKEESRDQPGDRDMAEIRRSLRAIESMLEELVERSREKAESFARSEHN